MPGVSECWSCETDTATHRCGGYYASYTDVDTGDWCETAEDAAADAERWWGQPLDWTWFEEPDTCLAQAPPPEPPMP